MELREDPEYDEGGTEDVFPRPRSLGISHPTHNCRCPSASMGEGVGEPSTRRKDLNFILKAMKSLGCTSSVFPLQAVHTLIDSTCKRAWDHALFFMAFQCYANFA